MRPRAEPVVARFGPAAKTSRITKVCSDYSQFRRPRKPMRYGVGLRDLIGRVLIGRVCQQVRCRHGDESRRSGAGAIQCGDLRGIQIQFGGTEQFLELLHAGGADDRRADAGAGQ